MFKMKSCKLWLRGSFFVIVLVLIYLPLIIVVLVSFNGSSTRGNIVLDFGNVLNPNPDAKSAYLRLGEADFAIPLLNSVIIGLITVIVSIPIAIMTAFALLRSRQWLNKTVFGIANFSLATPDIITGISLVLLFANTWLSFNQQLGFFTIISSHISFSVPYALVLIYPKMQKLNRNLILASQDLGYSPIATFFHITLPYLLPSILSAILVVFATSFDDYVITSLVQGSVKTVASELYSFRKGIKAWAIAFGAILILVSILAVLLVTLHKYLRFKHKEMLRVKQWKNS
ncbi:ABC transporter permease [Mycoplasmoides pneumoniae]|uniref:Polyamine (Spermidine/putrescine) ABC transporter permease n=3 Tax=Mycoplasmoides pneumoniae TaxID=2104 RepID=A0AAP8JFJ4_MYCPM|nr:ABC transporter permease [Mycoplasmoides pneumoniae]ALA29935.1 spermidine/putrescine ABC transporter permease [Mycoplasmoides pneumoniae PI 1428]ALA30904.1 spermidine/putrescine ABC transporter permease [Mycoplasmoides pneumoniae 19294]ALA31340.1 spermidine/putrescine ABC transporter permease [Mycoplasmoides pneumoniae 39443]ALA32050.1 spermidine/putrescine ABC transporter permease [Mycoplasmoides pneumoniae 51494]ALA32753.1 spermidine/putrescine ABC transporter permease [Mycoplasmoides pne